ncbi:MULTISPECIES: ABC transporter permease [Ensifer]|jgi:spermidine/putrescine transport system permease protein|uniref:ABC transporter permease subunit n=1 Tax=Ensifer canadensis TaxID=555315 RepID=A0AAW4FGC5_9HYPH|nr:MULTISPECIES: ABC transporter permease [Ensifer]MDP9631078.1 spermidine/putrescine transport system permease protein [Ensifer adhaerens]KQU82047.1 spermidine/putrescine ABC transporter permease [Ensifer sp. Root31]KQW61977.1 spermidine/putrescine ABC transporter permease [Ensifer sp. Root1252]KQW82084.1 spermidine/putrescine ABC transporter permease [Ensifer sp. Root127]KQY78781.1 spermidine/putrescine ABC transporter permease [Ensifer sp. Root142]
MSIAIRRRVQLAVLLGPVSLFLAVFFLGPLAIMMVTSFLAPGLYGGVEWTFYPHNFGRILGFADPMFEDFDPVYIAIFIRSVKIAALTVIAALLVCYPAAFCIARLSERWKNFCLFLITLPFFTSLIVRLFVWVLILRQTGLVNEMLLSTGLIARPLDLIYTDGAIILGMVYVFIPFMFMPVYASVEKLDWTLVRASLDLGAGPIRTFWRIILPLTAPGIAGGAIIVFIPALGNFVVPAILGGAKVMMLGNLIEQQFLAARNWPFGSALAMMVMSVMLVLLLVYVLASSRRGTDAALAR